MRTIAFFVAVSACCGQTTLSQYLALTSAQQTSIQQLNSDYASYLDKQNHQLAGINSQISQLYSSGSPDPAALGSLYVQEEMIRRDIAAHLSTLQTQAAAQLTNAQAGLVQQLGNSIVLQPLASDAACAFLMRQVPNPVSRSPFSGVTVFTTLNQTTGAIGYATFVLLQPYVPPAPTGTFCGSSMFPISIREYLSVTDTQVAALAAASAAYNDYYAKQQDQMNDLYVNIRDETAKPSPDPAALGFFYAQLAAIGKSISQEQADLQQQGQAVLTDAQKTALKKLQDAAALEPMAQAAETCNLLVQPPGTSQTVAIYDPVRPSGCQL